MKSRICIYVYTCINECVEVIYQNVISGYLWGMRFLVIFTLEKLFF